MQIIIDRDLVLYSDIAKDIDSLFQVGPAVLCDTSMALWVLIMEKRSAIVQASQFSPGERIFAWFASKWKPGMIHLPMDHVIDC